MAAFRMMMENEADLLSPVSAASRNDSTHSSLSYGFPDTPPGGGGVGSGVGSGDFDSKTP
jgi:hypothetical protein